MTVRRGGKAFRRIGCNGKSEISKSKYNSTHYLTVCSSVPFVKGEAAFGIAIISLINLDARHLNGIFIALKKRRVCSISLINQNIPAYLFLRIRKLPQEFVLQQAPDLPLSAARYR